MDRNEERALAKSSKFLSRGKIDAALDSLKESAEENPISTLIPLELSRLYLRQGKREDAAGWVRRALKARSDSLEHVDTFIAGIRQSGDDVTPYIEMLAEHHVRNRDLASAVQTLERIRDEIPKCRDRALPRAQKLLSETAGKPINPQLLPSVYLVALCHELTGQYGAAAQIYASVIERNPQEAEGLLARMGEVLTRDAANLPLRLKVIETQLRLGKIKEALEQCTLAIDSDPKSAGPVAAALEAALPIAADPLPLKVALVRARAREGKVDEALKALRPLVEAGKALDFAFTMLEELARRKPDYPATMSLLGEVYLRRGKNREALAVFGRLKKPAQAEEEKLLRRVLEKDPGCFPAVEKMTDLLIESGRAEEAVELCAKALEASAGGAGAPSPASLPASLASLTPRLQRLLEINPGSRQAHLVTARVLALSGEREAAGLLLRHALVTDPRSADAVGLTLAALPPPAADAPEARHLRLARMEEALARGDQAAALTAAEQALAAEPAALPDALGPLLYLVTTDPSCASRLRDALSAHASEPGCEAALAYVAGECAAADGDIPGALRSWRESATSRPQIIPLVRRALQREGSREGAPPDIEVALVDLLLDQSDFGAASSALIDLVKRRPDSAPLCLERFGKLLHAEPENLDVRVGLVAAYAACREFDQALDLGEETVRLDPGGRTAALRIMLADVHIEKGEVEPAMQQFLSAVEVEPNITSDVVARLERLRQKDPAQPAVHLTRGRVLAGAERAAEAVDSLAEAWRLDPAQADAVLEQLDRLQESRPADLVMRLLRTRIWTSKGEFDAAAETLGQLLDANPEQARSTLLLADKILQESAAHPATLMVRGRALLAQKQVVAACETFEKLFRADPESANHLLPWCQKLIAADPDAAEPYLLACDLNLAQKRPAAAGEALEAALKRNLAGRERFVERLAAVAGGSRDDGALLLLLADEQLRAGQPDAAISSLMDAVARDASQSEAAVGVVERVLAAHPEMADAHLMRARLQAKRGSIETALADVRQFLRHAPSRRAEVLPVLAALRKRDPKHFGALTTSTDLLIEERHYEEAAAALKDGVAAITEPALKLALYMRQWQLHVAQGKDGLARQVLENARALAPDPSQFLEAVHKLMIETTQRTIEQIRERTASGAAAAADVESLVSSLVLLGRHEEARQTLSRWAQALERPSLARLHSAIAERQGEYGRALEFGRAAGADRLLVHCADRAGQVEEAHRLLVRLVEEGREIALEPMLARYELEVLRRDLHKDRNVLQAVTTVVFEI